MNLTELCFPACFLMTCAAKFETEKSDSDRAQFSVLEAEEYHINLANIIQQLSYYHNHSTYKLHP